MNAVGIDVSKGKSTVAIFCPFGEILTEPFDAVHNDDDLTNLIKRIKSSCEAKVVMEYTDKYYEQIACTLYINVCIFVSVVNAILVHNYGGNSIRRFKPDKKDSIKLASYAHDKWVRPDRIYVRRKYVKS